MILLAIAGFCLGLIANGQVANPLAASVIYRLTGSSQDEPARIAPFDGTAFFDAAFSYAQPAPLEKGQEPHALIVNHHLLAADLIAQAMDTVATEKRRTVLLISPNHFGQGRDALIISGRDWQTPYGRLLADVKTSEILSDAGLATIDEQRFEKEHGIYNILPFIKKRLPNARVVTMMVRDGLTSEQAESLAIKVSALLPKDTLIIGSFDFSHGVTDSVADFHDAKTVDVLSSQYLAGVDSMNIDSRPGLAMLMALSRERDAAMFVPFAHKNAVDYTKDDSMLDVTSYFTGAYVVGSAAAPRTTTVLALGDIMLDRHVRLQIEKKGNKYPFANIERFLDGSDLTVANLEGTVTNMAPKRLEPDNIVFTFDPSVATTLRDLSFDVVSLANNHIDDFGAEGLRQTKDYLRAADIEYFGDYFNQEEVMTIQDVRGIRLAFIGFHEFSYAGRENVLNLIKQAHQEADFVIVYPHWGAEYLPRPDQNQVTLAHQFINVGADIVLGAHPHVVQPIEIYKDKLIVYSMGNFVFDQQFSTAVKNGLGLGLVLRKDRDGLTSVEVSLFPYSISPRIQVELYPVDQAKSFYKQYAAQSTASEDILAAMSQGVFELNWP